MESITSNSLYLMERSMSFLWEKQAALLDNISNAETPNYKAKTVTFEDSLREKIGDASKGTGTEDSVRKAIEDAHCTTEETADSTRMDGNGVNITEQNVELVRNAYQMQYVLKSISSDLSTLHTAITG